MTTLLLLYPITLSFISLPQTAPTAHSYIVPVPLLPMSDQHKQKEQDKSCSSMFFLSCSQLSCHYFPATISANPGLFLYSFSTKRAYFEIFPVIVNHKRMYKCYRPYHKTIEKPLNIRATFTPCNITRNIRQNQITKCCKKK